MCEGETKKFPDLKNYTVPHSSRIPGSAIDKGKQVFYYLLFSEFL